MWLRQRQKKTETTSRRNIVVHCGLIVTKACCFVFFLAPCSMRSIIHLCFCCKTQTKSWLRISFTGPLHQNSSQTMTDTPKHIESCMNSVSPYLPLLPDRAESVGNVALQGNIKTTQCPRRSKTPFYKQATWFDSVRVI